MNLLRGPTRHMNAELQHTITPLELLQRLPPQLYYTGHCSRLPLEAGSRRRPRPPRHSVADAAALIAARASRPNEGTRSARLAQQGKHIGPLTQRAKAKTVADVTIAGFGARQDKQARNGWRARLSSVSNQVAYVGFEMSHMLSCHCVLISQENMARSRNLPTLLV